MSNETKSDTPMSDAEAMIPRLTGERSFMWFSVDPQKAPYGSFVPIQFAQRMEKTLIASNARLSEAIRILEMVGVMAENTLNESILQEIDTFLKGQQ